MSIEHDEMYDYLTGEGYVTEDDVKNLLSVQRKQILKLLHANAKIVHELEKRIYSLESLIGPKTDD